MAVETAQLITDVQLILCYVALLYSGAVMVSV